MNLIKYVLAELKNNRRFSLLFILNLSFGLVGFISLDGFKASLDYTLKQKSKAVLGADFGLSARRRITDQERQNVKNLVGSEHQESEMIEIFSMVANQKQKSRLIQIKAIQKGYPFYGDLELNNKKYLTTQTVVDLNQNLQALVYPEILTQLKVKVGEKLKIGDVEFTIKDVVQHDPASGFTTNVAPRIYIGLNQLQKTGLMKPGTIAWYSFVYKIPNATTYDLKNYRDQLYEKTEDADLRLYTHEDVSEQMGRLLNYLNDFLGLASLVALFLASIGSGFLFRSYLRSRIKSIAIYISLGLKPTAAISLYFLQLFILGLISSVLAMGLSWLLVPVLGSFTVGLLPFAIIFKLEWTTLLIALLLGTLGSLVMCLPILLDLRTIQPSLLFSNKMELGSLNIGQKILYWMPGVLSFWGLSIWQSHSFIIGGLFTLSFFVSCLVLVFIGWLVLRFLSKIKITSPLSLKWALRNMTRDKLASISCFLSIGLGVLLMNLIPQLQKSLDQELQNPQQSKLPSLFMFDIQDEQLADLKKLMSTQGLNLSQVSPFIRARLLSVNDIAFDKGEGASSKTLSREEEQEMRFRNRGFNLSYRDKLIDSETMIEGRAFSGVYSENSDQMAEISLEYRFAHRLELKVGDVLEFEIESVPIKGQVINLRRVKWNSFQPNFFIQFQPGVLEGAPKTHVATVPHLTVEQKNSVQDKIVEHLPNISILDVTRVIERISTIIVQMGWALKFMSVLCLLAGFVVIYSISNHQAKTNRVEIGLLKSLGAEFSDIRSQFIWHFGLLSLGASLFGMLLSLIFSYALSFILFESLWVFDLASPTLYMFLAVVVTIMVTDLAIRSALRLKANQLFSM